MRKLALILLLVLVVGVSLLDAATTGRLAVRVRDNSAKTLAYVNVSVFKGSQRVTGGQTNEKGTAIIINIPPGSYTVKFSLIGYNDAVYQDVRVQVDQTASLTPIMTRAGITTATVVVKAEADKAGKDRVGSSRQIEMGQLADASVTNVSDIIALQAGVTNVGGELHIRGGRPNEVNYTVDGMSVSDPVDGGSALQVDTDAISDMKVMTGGFPAEYGNAQSAVINIVTKDGDANFSGKIEYNTDHILGEGRNSDVVKFAIGGPLVPFANDETKEKLTFYLNGGGEWLDGRLKDYYIADPNADYLYNGVQLLEYDYEVYNPYSGRKNVLGVDVGNRNYNSYNVNFKSKYAINPTQKITFAARGDRSFNFPFSYSSRYAMQHYAFDETNQRQYIGTYDHVFNSSMNLKAKLSYYSKDSTSGPRGISRDNYMGMDIDPSTLAGGPDSPAGIDYINNVLLGEYGYSSVDDDADGVYDIGYLPASFWIYRIASVETPRTVPGFSAPGSIYTNFVDDKTSTYSGRADFEWQLNETHLAKSGFEIIQHQIEKNQLQNFLSVYEDRRQEYLRGIYDMDDYTAGDPVPNELFSIVDPGDDSPLIPIYKPEDYFKAALAASGKRDGYKAHPIQAAYYIQDKMEWEGMIVNAGLRFDGWYLGKDYQVAQDDGTYNTVTFPSKDRFQLMVSPRLGVSHPITDKTVLRFAYNYQNQLPQMQFIFTSKTPADANVSDQVITVGNPELKPQITVTYEVGLSHQLSEDYVLDVTAYYKNLYNYVSTIKEKKPGEEQITWYKFISEDYGSARGIDMQLEKILSNFQSWSIAYSLAWAQGNNSSTVIQDEMTNLREFPLDWDIRHNVSVNYTFRIGRGEEFFVPFTDFILPFDDFTANLTWSMSSGTPYTPIAANSNNSLDTNSKRKGLTQQADLRLSKGITLSDKMNIRLFMDVENLFKTNNILTVYPRTGLPDDDGADIADSVTGYVYPEVAHVHGLQVRNPGFTNNYRGVTFGVSFNF